MKQQPEPAPLDQAADALEAMATAMRALSARAKEEEASPAMLKPEEVARRLAVALSTVYRLVKTRELRACQVAGGAIRVTEADLAKFVKARTEVHA